MIEKNIQKKIINHIKMLGGDCFKIMAPSRRGCPDLIALLYGNVLLIEVKQEGKKLDKLQEYFFTIWNHKKTNCIKVDSVFELVGKLKQWENENWLN